MAYWTLTNLRAKFRALTGRPDTSSLPNADIDAYLNQFYQGILPEILHLEKKDGWWQFNTTASDSGSYAYASNLIVVRPPLYVIRADPPVEESYPWTEGFLESAINVDQGQLRVFTEPEAFYGSWPQQVTYTRAQPIDALLWARTLAIMPPPDQIYTIAARAEKSDFAALVNPLDGPEQDNWGAAIAYGAAIEFLNDKGDAAQAGELAGMFEYHLRLCNRREIRNMMFKRAVPRF